MEQSKIHQDAIRARICESQLLRIAFPKSDFGKHAAGDPVETWAASIK